MLEPDADGGSAENSRETESTDTISIIPDEARFTERFRESDGPEWAKAALLEGYYRRPPVTEVELFGRMVALGDTVPLSQVRAWGAYGRSLGLSDEQVRDQIHVAFKKRYDSIRPSEAA